MKPKSFDIDTCKELLGDVLLREIELKARKDADAREFLPPEDTTGLTYWARVKNIASRFVYAAQWCTRNARNRRKIQT